MREFIELFYLPKELRIKAFWYMLCNITIMSSYFLMCFLEDRLFARVCWAFCVVGTYFFAQIFISLIIRNKMQDFFFYIFLANAIDIVIATIEIFLFLKDLHMWVMIFPLILLALLSGYSMMEFFFDKQMKLFKKKLLQIDKCIYKEFDGYAWHSYYKGSMEFLWLPVDNDKFEPHFNYGDMLCIKEVIPVYKDDYLDFNTHRNWKYVVKDNNGVFHLCATEIREIEKDGVWSRVEAIIPYPNMELDKDNVKCLYEVVDEISDLKVYDDTW
ncbi:MAG: hypothetical protein J6L03_05460 [Bacteroidaceae bacterium]|nr:hypothetical protein [Bacteroidaceae bacterium]